MGVGGSCQRGRAVTIAGVRVGVGGVGVGGVVGAGYEVVEPSVHFVGGGVERGWQVLSSRRGDLHAGGDQEEEGGGGGGGTGGGGGPLASTHFTAHHHHKQQQARATVEE
ncbi:hypothetical protein E2C01_079857 [Portunus trituberculatus]|uniref:Uncharacterized protein n=1 Tax=Portunus trituberculatus TaxID=210409 RepID=A0A5B7IUF5_PORTR|nr:hypothetical protein [Portunus trituberculatus]